MVLLDFNSVFGSFTKMKPSDSPRKYFYYGSGTYDFLAYALIGGAAALYCDWVSKSTKSDSSESQNEQEHNKSLLDNMKVVTIHKDSATTQ